MQNVKSIIRSDKARRLYTDSDILQVYLAKLKKTTQVAHDGTRCDVIFLYRDMVYFYKYKKTRSQSASVGYIQYDNRAVAYNSFINLLNKLDNAEEIELSTYSKKFLADCPQNDITTKVGLIAHNLPTVLEANKYYTIFALNDYGTPIHSSDMKDDYTVEPTSTRYTEEEDDQATKQYVFFESSDKANNKSIVEEETDNMTELKQWGEAPLPEKMIPYPPPPEKMIPYPPPFFNKTESKTQASVLEAMQEVVDDKEPEETPQVVESIEEERPLEDLLQESPITIKILNTTPETIRTIETVTEGILIVTNRSQLLVDMSGIHETEIMKTIYISTYALLENGEPVKLQEYLEKISAIVSILIPKHATPLYKG